MRNRLLSSNGGLGEVLQSCQDAGVGGAGIADVYDSARGSANGVSSHLDRVSLTRGQRSGLGDHAAGRMVAKYTQG